MLTQHLRELERDGVVARQIFDEMPLRVEYSLTKYGQTLRPLMRVLCDWGSKHEAHVARNCAKPAQRIEPAAPKRIAVAIG
jgi:DNA-binding HxlR family transcriptional regulator